MQKLTITEISCDDLTLIIESAVSKALGRITPKSPAKYLNINQAAEFLDLKRQTIYQKVSKSEIPYIKKHGRLYFGRQDLIDYLNSGRVGSKSEYLSNQ